MVSLGSDVIIISVDDARLLVSLLQGKSRAEIEQLQKSGALVVLDALRDAIRRCDYGEGEG